VTVALANNITMLWSHNAGKERSTMRSRLGFTLIELLVVIAII